MADLKAPKSFMRWFCERKFGCVPLSGIPDSIAIESAEIYAAAVEASGLAQISRRQYGETLALTVDQAQRIHELEAKVNGLKERLSATKCSVVATVGGVDYEGNPTSEINYLQRLRILVEKETRLESRVKELTDALAQTFSAQTVTEDIAARHSARAVLQRGRES